MSEEKLYAVKNDEGIYWDFLDSSGFWALYSSDCPTTTSKDQAELVADEQGAHVVTLIEEPEKVVLSKEQAEIVEGARDATYPASYISNYTNSHDCEERLLIEAFVNGWTVEKPKRYVLPMPGTDYHNYQMHGNAQYYAVKGTGNWRPDAIALDTDDAVKHGYTVTQSDIDDAPSWVKAIKPLEVTDDGMGC
jgi:hypothetical protein